MSVRVCDSCQLGLPVSFKDCPVCAKETRYSPTGECPNDWEAQVKRANEIFNESPTTRDVKSYHIAEWRKQGFTRDERNLLWEHKISWRATADLLARGCSHALAVEILI